MPGTKHEHVREQTDLRYRAARQRVPVGDQADVLIATFGVVQAVRRPVAGQRIEIELFDFEVARAVDDFEAACREAGVAFGQDAFHAKKERAFDFVLAVARQTLTVGRQGRSENGGHFLVINGMDILVD